METKQSILDFINMTISRVRAYKLWLRENGANIQKVTEKNFYKLPPTSKEEYIQKNELKNLLTDGKLPEFSYASSGSSGKPTFWFRGETEEKIGAELHAKLLQDGFKIKKTDRVLVVVTFSMGIWVAGNYTQAAFRSLSKMGYQITTITPGIDKEDIFKVLKNLTPFFEHIIIAGYPPFISDLVQGFKKENINLAKKKVFFLLGGDKFSEEWRDSIGTTFSSQLSEYSILGVYGSADIGMMASETRLSVYLRRAAWKNKKLNEELFGIGSKLPFLGQFEDEYVYIEEDNGELLITAKTGIPLIRYRIHDKGRVISFSDILKLLKKYGMYEKAKQQGLLNQPLPFVSVTGRTDVACTFYALNIYPEYIKISLEKPSFSRLLSGNYLVYTKSTGPKGSEQLCIEVELAHDVAPTKKLKEKLTNAIFASLLKESSEYRKLHASIGMYAIPHVILSKNKSRELTLTKGRGLLQIKGKKPRVLFA